MPEVSVIIPSYNHARFLREAVDSVLQQTLADLELVVVDDGSQDQSLDILRGYADARLRVIAQENRGAHAAINRGIEISTGTYIAILNSDDVYAPERLAKMAACLRENPGAGLAASHIQVIDPGGARLGVKHGFYDLEPWPLAHPEKSFRSGNDSYAPLLTENYLATTSNYFFERNLIERIGGFRPLRYAHDWDFALRAAEHSRGRLALLPEPLLNYRIHPQNTIRENKAAMIFEICWILAVHLPGGMQLLASQEDDFPEVYARLLNSVYCYRCEPVLIGLFSLGLAHDQDRALQLLDRGNPLRLESLSFIEHTLQDTSPEAASRPTILRRLRNFLRRLATN